MIPVTDAAPRSREWLDARRQGIGGSDIAVILGASPYTTPLQLWEHKFGLSETEETPVMRRGSALEPTILNLYEEENSAKVSRWPAIASIYADDDYPVARVSFDGIDQDNCPVEAKATSQRWDRLPPHIEAQALWQAGIARAPWTRVVVLRGTDLTVTTVEHDPDWFDWARAEARDWWVRHIMRHIQPDPRPGDDMARLWQPEDDRVAQVDPGLWERYVMLRAAGKELADELKAVEVAVQTQVGPATVVEVEGRKVATWKKAKGRARVDIQALRDVDPALVERCTVVGAASRTWRVSG